MKRIKSLLKKVVYSNNFLFKCYYKFLYWPKDSLSKFLKEFSKKMHHKVFFMQIGANDGIWDDPFYKYIRTYNWRGILIEPQKDVYEKLKSNYTFNKNLLFVNAAIDKFDGERKLYKIAFCNSNWATVISSFDEYEIQKLIKSGYVKRKSEEENIPLPKDENDYIKTEIVRTVTFNYIFKKYDVEKIDILMIDTEGYDFEIIKMIPFERIRPNIIIFEHSHLAIDQKENCYDFLIKNSYKLINYEADSIAINIAKE